MTDYYLIHDYIYKACNEFYLINRKKTLYAYDYSHNLLSQTSCLRNLEKIYLFSNGQVIIHLHNKDKMLVWDVLESSLKEISYCGFENTTINHIVPFKKNIYTFFKKSNYQKSSEYYISCIDNNYITYNLIKIENQFTNVFSHNNRIYFENIKYSKVSEKRLPKACYELYTLKENKLKKIIQTGSLYESIFKISNSDKYAFLISTYTDEDYTKCYGQLTIFDFQKYSKIDSFKINHMGFYRPIAYFFYFNDKDYIIFQANPVKCPFDNEIWHTYIYSVNEKKIIHESKFQISLRYFPNQKLLIIETNYRKKKTIFYKFDDLLNVDIEWVIENLLTSKFLGMKLSSKG